MTVSKANERSVRASAVLAAQNVSKKANIKSGYYRLCYMEARVVRILDVILDCRKNIEK